MKRIERAEVPRDRWGRPEIDGTSYTRTSTLAKTLDDQSNLIAWKARMTALGLAKSPDLIGLAATATEKDRTLLNDVVERATDRAGAGSGRDLGTSIHAVTEALDYNEPVDNLPTDLVDDGRAYQRCCESLGLVPVLAETFVVSGQYGAAGTFDRLLTDGKTYFIGDVKTGKLGANIDYVTKYSGLAWAIQLAVYSAGRPWNDGWQTWEGLGAGDPSVEKGVIFQIPRGSGTCNPVWIDLSVGHRAARLAAEVRAIKSAKVVAA